MENKREENRIDANVQSGKKSKIHYNALLFPVIRGNGCNPKSAIAINVIESCNGLFAIDVVWLICKK